MNLRVKFFETKDEILDYKPDRSTDGLCFAIVSKVDVDALSFEFELIFDDQEASSF